jgi:multiple sugar transport system ATP-binding protein
VPYGDRVTTSSVRPVALRNGVIEDPLGVVLGFLEAHWAFDLSDPSGPTSFAESDLRLANRGGARISGAEIAAIQDRLGVTTVYVTHDQVEAMTMGDRVAVLKRGVLMQADSPQTLYDRPDNLFVAGFIGSPSMNIAKATLVRENGQVFVELGRTRNRLRVDDRALQRYPRVAEREGGRVAIGLRPEHFAPAGDVPADQVWSGRQVTLVEVLGAEMLVHIGTSAPPIISDDMREAIDDDEAFEQLKRQAAEGGQVFTARFEPGNPPSIGDKIDVGFRTEYLHFFDPESGAALR